jgi:hypothetical protein
LFQDHLFFWGWQAQFQIASCLVPWSGRSPKGHCPLSCQSFSATLFCYTGQTCSPQHRNLAPFPMSLNDLYRLPNQTHCNSPFQGRLCHFDRFLIGGVMMSLWWQLTGCTGGNECSCFACCDSLHPRTFLDSSWE